MISSGDTSEWTCSARVAIWSAARTRAVITRRSAVRDWRETTGNPQLLVLVSISSPFRFYLSFENSFCSGYVTEKFYKALSLDIIPVGERL